ncbi:MAG: ComF family protein [Nitrospiraceae bacterium]|nr:MAG: ComF family protein [Nitrospiraceae bacterium]
MTRLRQSNSRLFNSVFDRLLNILFPESCPICGSPTDAHETAPICNQCWQSLRPYNGPACGTCGRPLFSNAAVLCGICMKEAPAFSSARAFGLYEGTLRKAINLFKYHRIRRLSRPLTRLVLGGEIPSVRIVLPVPLHKRRLREREFNQSALLAKGIAKKISADLAVDCLVRTRDTLPQVGLRSGERRRNIKNAFAASSRTSITGRSVLLVDDVITTGSTVQECSDVLKKAGAREVHVLALARGAGD